MKRKRTWTPEECREVALWKRSLKKPEFSKRKRKRIEVRQHYENRCRAYLKEFWPKFNSAKNYEEKLALLKLAANPPWNRVPVEMMRKLRSRYNQMKVKFIPLLDGECGCCGNEFSEERHHIIPLAFGGVNETLNLIGIGLDCHDAIHPWLKQT